MNNITTRGVFYLREYFFPSGCGGCGEALMTPEDAYYGLCGDCRSLLVSALDIERRCNICGRILITEIDTCLVCRKPLPETESNNRKLVKIRALFPYTGKYRAILGAYKFRKSLGVGNFLAHCIKSGIEDLTREPAFEAESNPVLVPVPARPGKIKKQGWDQIEYLAGLLEKSRILPVRRCLKRLPSKSQKELNREERASNLSGRILCVKQPPGTVIIFDDVITTGATLNACASALLEGGAEKVYGLCLFYD